MEYSTYQPLLLAISPRRIDDALWASSSSSSSSNGERERASIRKVIIDFETTIRPYQKVSYHFDRPLETLQSNLEYKKLIIVPVTDNLGTGIFYVKKVITNFRILLPVLYQNMTYIFFLKKKSKKHILLYLMCSLLNL